MPNASSYSNRLCSKDLLCLNRHTGGFNSVGEQIQNAATCMTERYQNSFFMFFSLLENVSSQWKSQMAIANKVLNNFAVTPVRVHSLQKRRKHFFDSKYSHVKLPHISHLWTNVSHMGKLSKESQPFTGSYISQHKIKNINSEQTCQRGAIWKNAFELIWPRLLFKKKKKITPVCRQIEFLYLVRTRWGDSWDR